jgi:hypothetical protein
MLFIMFHIIYHVASNLLVSNGVNALVNPCVVFQELTHFYPFSVLPLGVPIFLVQFHCLLVVSWDKDTKFPKWVSSVALQFGLVDLSFQLLFVLCESSKLLPSLSV